MKKIALLASISIFAACGLQVRGTGTNTTGNPNVSAFTVGGQANGIPVGKNVKVTIGGNEYSIDENGSFTFPLNFESGSSYDVNVVTGPGGAYACTLENDAGTIANSNVTNVFLNCECAIGSLGNGSGLELDPVLVYTAPQLNGIANAATWTNMNQHYKQVCDLDYGDMAPKPIGSNSLPFNGSYNGDGWFILNYTSNETVPALNQRKGLFGLVQDAKLTNINLLNFALTATTTGCGGSMGALVAKSAGSQIENIYADDITINAGTQSMNGIGGLIGTNVHFACQSGCTYGSLFNGLNVNDADIFAVNSENVGGVFGTTDSDANNVQISNSHIHDCDFQCGGVAGSLTGKKTFEEINAQNLTVEGNESVGGITGLNYGVISRSAFVGTVEGKTTAGKVGGINGNGSTFDPIYNSYSVSDVLTVAGSIGVGRISGVPSLITNVAYDNTQTCQNCSVVGGTGVVGNSSFENATNAAMTSWNFSTNWCVVENDYPQLVNVPFSVCN
jgi:hypothetical protein